FAIDSVLLSDQHTLLAVTHRVGAGRVVLFEHDDTVITASSAGVAHGMATDAQILFLLPSQSPEFVGCVASAIDKLALRTRAVVHRAVLGAVSLNVSVQQALH
ncbi:hypothetical protein PMAYCL1PPCAC_00268, partial [Pristionchus mayeri]